jgi:hypothetical protein
LQVGLRHRREKSLPLKQQWRAMADEDGQYSFAVAL